MNELCDYPSIQFENNLYVSLKTKDSRLLLRQMKTAIEFFHIHQQLDSEMFTILYYGVQQIQKEEIFDFVAKEILSTQETLEFEILQLKFLQATQEESFKGKREQQISIIKDALFQFGQFEKHGQMGMETLLLFYKQKIKELEIKQFLQNQFKKVIKKEANHNFCKNRLIQITFNSDDSDQQIADLLISSENTAFITSYITILAQNSMELSQNENNSIKQVSKILERISSQLPNLFNQNLPVFLQFYDNENYQLRNTISTIISNILTEHLNPSKIDQDIELKEMQLKQRLFLIQTLYQRIHDKHAFCRVHILKLLKNVCSQNLIPPNVQLAIFPLVIGRVQDSSSLVRKSALAFIKQITKFMKNLFVDGLQIFTFMKLTEIKEQNQFLEQEIHKILQALDQILDEKTKTDSEKVFKELEDEENLVAANLREKKKLFQIFSQYEEFMGLIQQLLPNLELLLNSKSTSDILKAISLITFFFKQKIENTDIGVMKMLIHSNNPQVVIKLAKKFQNLFIDNENELITINNLIHLLKISSQKEQIYLEQLLQYLIKQKIVTDQLIENIWANFIKCYFSNQTENLCFYSKLIRITMSQTPQLLTFSKFDQINKIIEGQKKEINWPTLIELSKLIYYLQDKVLIKKYFQSLALVIYFNFGTPNCNWFVACQEVLNLIQFLPVPESIYDYIIKKFTFKIFQVDITPKRMNQSFLEEESSYDYNNSCIQLSQLLFIVGQSALAIIIHIDDFENQLKHIRNVEEEKEIEIDKIQGGSEEEYEQNSLYVQNICKNSISQAGFYSTYINIINDILDEYEATECAPSMLHKNASLCLCKLMCLCEEFCSKNIERIFKMIQKPYADGVFKNNLIVAFGDLLHRWPNTVTSYCRSLFDDLSNQDFIVKRTSMNVLQHLILNDMIKIKREITDIALLQTDLDENIQQQARKFFHQLQKKDSRKIINSLPDIINSMSNQECHEKYKIFLSNIIKYFDKQTDLLVEKLLKRMKENINEWEIENIAFTLSKLQMKEGLARKFYDCYSYYQERLEKPQIKEYFQQIIQKLMRCGLSQENKQILLEFEELLNKGETKRRIVGSKYKSQKSSRTQTTNSQRSINVSNVLDQIFTQNSDF